MEWSKRNERILNLLSNIEICRNSNVFIGTAHPNTDDFLWWIMDNDKIERLPWERDDFIKHKEKYFTKSLT